MTTETGHVQTYEQELYIWYYNALSGVVDTRDTVYGRLKFEYEPGNMVISVVHNSCKLCLMVTIS